MLLVPLPIGGALGAYLLYVRVVERRSASELGLGGAGRELAVGGLLGCGLMVASVGVLWLLGAYQVVALNPPLVLLGALAAALFRGFVEELLLRGIGLRIGTELLGAWPALFLSAAIFGLLHVHNPGASLWSGIAITLEAGLLLGAAFLYTGRLWMAVGLHTAWNFSQGGFFGLHVSGTPSIGLLRGELLGPAWLSGGDFGIEASPLVVMLCLIAAGALLWSAQRRRHVGSSRASELEPWEPSPSSESS